MVFPKTGQETAMKKILAALTALSLLAGAAGSATAQPRRDNDRYERDYRNDARNDRRDDRRDYRSDYRRHPEWRKGARMARNDWNRGRRVDYRTYRLPPPHRGYEWRQVDGNYVMAAVATGLIFSIMAANR
jgi:Ni/Co efflux regulator RcnB